MILLGHPEKVGNDQKRERPRVRRQELTLAVGDELVDVAVGQPPHEVLVLLQPLGRQQSGKNRPCVGVLRRIHRDHVLEHGNFGAVLLELRADVVTFGHERHRRERTHDRNAGRVVLAVLVNGVGRFPAGDRYHAVVDGTAHRVLGAYVVVVRVWVGHERRVGEVFDGVVIGGHVERFLPEPVVAAMAGRRAVLNVRDTQYAEHLLSTAVESRSR